MQPTTPVSPRVSIVIPCFNSAHWLRASLDSALAQTYTNVEIIAIDDGSTDQTTTILADYQQRHGIRVLTQPNRGQSAANNAGVTESTGDYIKFFDSDDLLSPESISTQVQTLGPKTNHLAYGTWGRFHDNPSQTAFNPHPGWHDSDSGLEWLVETWADTEPMYQCGLWLIPRSLLEKTGGWDERLSLINDFEFFTRLVLASDGIVFTPEAKLYYRSGIPGSLSAQKSRRAWESACLSSLLSVEHLLNRENSERTCLRAADILQKLVYAFYPSNPELKKNLLQRIEKLGGSSLPPDGGPWVKRLARVFGWRAALRLRQRLGRRSA